MCGIVGSVSTRNIVPILVQGLQRLEYRGYDSCGVAVYADGLKRARSTSRVAELMEQVASTRLEGLLGIAHTRWATHGAPAIHNAHPHFSHGPESVFTGTVAKGKAGVKRAANGGAQADESSAIAAQTAASRPGRVALVHNGIIENHDELRAQLKARGYAFMSQTDTEVIAHLIDSLYDGDIFEAVKAAVKQLHGAYAIAVFCKDEPHRLIGARAGGKGGHRLHRVHHRHLERLGRRRIVGARHHHRLHVHALHVHSRHGSGLLGMGGTGDEDSSCYGH